MTNECIGYVLDSYLVRNAIRKIKIIAGDSEEIRQIERDLLHNEFFVPFKKDDKSLSQALGCYGDEENK